MRRSIASLTNLGPRTTSAVNERQNDSMCALSPRPLTVALRAMPNATNRSRNGASRNYGPRSQWKVSPAPGDGGAFRSRAFDAWAAHRGITLAFFQPCKPLQNTHIASFSGRFRDECLNQHYFLSLADARFHLARWRRAFSEGRPHEARFPITPSEYARTFPPSPSVRQTA